MCIKMNERVNKFLLVGDKFMPGMHFKKPSFIYIACAPFTKNKEKMSSIKLVFKMIWFMVDKKI